MGVDNYAIFGYGTPLEHKDCDYVRFDALFDKIQKETGVRLEYAYASYENYSDWFVYVEENSIFGGGKTAQATPTGKLVLEITDAHKQAIELFKAETNLDTEWNWYLYTYML